MTQLRNILEHIDQGVVAYDSDRRVIAWNRNFQKIMRFPDGFLSVGLPGSEIGRLLAKRGDLGEGEADELSTERASFLWLVRPTSSEISFHTGKHYEVLTTPTPDGGLVISYTDITERKHAEAALRESEARLGNAAKIAKLGYWVWDAIGEKADYCSDELAEIYGVGSGQELVTMTQSHEADVEWVHPDDRAHFSKAVRKSKETKQSYHFEHRIVRADGEVRYLRVIEEPILDAHDRVIRVNGITQDVTESKLAEEQLQQAQRIEAIGQLTGGVAHDFNNLMAVMLGNAEILENRVGDDENARSAVEAIKRAVSRGASLTQRLLAFARKQPLLPVASNANGLIAGLRDMLRRTLGETIDLRVEGAPDNWPAMIDPHQFEDALLNLAINARDAMPNGGILTIETANITLNEAYAMRQQEVAPGDFIEVAVSDTGIGIPPETLDKVFEPFFTTKDVGKGSGLGLSMVYGFVKQSKGHVTIYSEIGHGTTVKLYLPRSPETVVQEDTKVEGLKHERGSERILVVEDDPRVREVPVRILREQGYEVVEASDGVAAIKLLEGEQQFDLLFSDVVLPGGMNGMSVAEKAKRIQPNIKVLYTTGYAENAVAHGQWLDPEATLVNKPYRRAELLGKVRTMLDSGDV